jgi:hypothetical protein
MTKPEGLNLGNINSSLILVGVFVLVIISSHLKTFRFSK